MQFRFTLLALKTAYSGIRFLLPRRMLTTVVEHGEVNPDRIWFKYQLSASITLNIFN